MFSEPLVFGGERNEDSPYAVVGFPFDSTSSYKPGSAFGPNAIREASKFIEFVSTITLFNMDNVLYDDKGDVPVVPGDVKASLANLETALHSLEDDKVPILLGGEHTLSYSAVKALEPDCLLVFDAHLDLRSDYLGNEWSHACWLRRTLEERELKVVVYGARGYAEEELEFAREKDVLIARGGGWVSHFVKGCKRLYLSVDIDVFEPSAAPGVGNPEWGGISFKEFLQALSEAVYKVPLVGMDVVEVSPPNDPSGITAALGARIVVEATALDYVTWRKKRV